MLLTAATRVRLPASHVRWPCGHQVRQVGFLRVLRFPPTRTQTSVQMNMIDIKCMHNLFRNRC